MLNQLTANVSEALSSFNTFPLQLVCAKNRSLPWICWKFSTLFHLIIFQKKIHLWANIASNFYDKNLTSILFLFHLNTLCVKM